MKTRLLWASIVIATLLTVSCKDSDDTVKAVLLDKTKLEIVKGQSARLTARVVPEQEAQFEWFSQDDQYVTVDQDGVVTALGLKKSAADPNEVSPVSVYVRYENGAAECQVTVLPLGADKVEIIAESETIQIDPGQKVTLAAKCYPEDADITTVTWSTDYAPVATVDPATGEVTGVTPGFAKIRASYSEKIYDEISVKVNAVAAQQVAIDPSSLEMAVGQKKRLGLVFTPANATDVPVWTSSDTGVVTVDNATGIVTAKAIGSADVKVQAGTVSAVCKVVVK